MRIPAKGKTQLAAAAGKLIGEAQATQEAIERSQRVQERLQSLAIQKEMTQFNQQLAIDRAKFNLAMDLEEEERARQWQLEKMELASRIDFEESERKRAAEKAEYEAGIRLIQENENLTDTQKDDAIYKFNLKKQAGYTVPREREEKPEEASEADIARAAKFLTEYEEPKWYQPFARKPTEAEKTLKTHYEKMVSGISTEPYSTTQTLPTPKTKAEYDALPPGTKYIHPQLGERIKR